MDLESSRIDSRPNNESGGIMSKALLVGCLFLLLPLQLAAQFGAHVDYAVGPDPFSVAPGDVNGDGKLDLVVTIQTSNTVGVLLGNGDGTFRPHVDYATGARPTSVIVADLNGDGKLDLAVANGNAGSVSVLLGSGNGTFQPHVDYAAQADDQFLVAADFNGDGPLDLATSNYDSGSVSIFLNNGDGTFQPQRLFAAGFTPFGVMAEDFNRDGKIDLAVLDNNSYAAVLILLGNGDGSFQPPLGFGAGRNPRVGVVGDFNNDGNLDLAIGNCIDSVVSVLFGDGHGNFSSAGTYAAGNNIQAVAGGDFDGDGSVDLVVANNTSDSVSILIGNRDGTFQAHVDYATGSGPNAVTVGDFNGDGAPDLATANWNGSTVSLLLNTRGATTTTTTLASWPNPAGPRQSVIYAASVASQNGQSVTGTVTFKDGGVAVATVTLENQLAAWSTKYLSVGLHEMTATYSGDAGNGGSTSAPVKELIQGSSKTVLVTSGSPSMVGKPVTFAALVTSPYGTIPDGGLVTFYDGTIPLGTATLAGGVAGYTTALLSAKTHNIKAVYGGDQAFKPSSALLKQVVERYSTTTTLRSAPNPSTFGQVVTFTAHVKSTGPTAPTGKVRLKDGPYAIGAATLSGGVATWSKSKLAVGTHPITAQYLGDAASEESTSAVVNQTVE
jgi:hypothetical protein